MAGIRGGGGGTAGQKRKDALPDVRAARR